MSDVTLNLKLYCNIVRLNIILQLIVFLYIYIYIYIYIYSSKRVAAVVTTSTNAPTTATTSYPAKGIKMSTIYAIFALNEPKFLTNYAKLCSMHKPAGSVYCLIP